MIKHYCDFCGCEIDYNSKFIYELKHPSFSEFIHKEICTKCYLIIKEEINKKYITLKSKFIESRG